MVLSDGTLANSLPTWDGGLGKQAGVPENEGERDASYTDLHVDTLKRKRRKTLSLGDGSEVLGTKANDKISIRRTNNTQSLTNIEDDYETHAAKVDDKESASIVHIQEHRRQPRNQLAKEILENLARFPHCILLTRVGQFYESYFDQAREVSQLLSIKLTKRTWDDQRVWMCGFPLMHLDKHLKTLVQQHSRSVAMCEEFRKSRGPFEDMNSKPSFERRVIRVLTPGTLIDESFLNPYENNYLLAIGAVDECIHSIESSDTRQQVGLAWIDVSTGEFFTRNTTFQALKDHIARISPREIVVENTVESSPSHPLQSALQDVNCPISYSTITFQGAENTITEAVEVTDDVVVASAITALSDVFSDAETSAITLLNGFLRANLLEHAPKALCPAREEKRRRMQIDSNTLKALEIRENIREGGTIGSLMSAIKRTVTSGGTRLLSRWLCSPSTSLEEIIARQSLVELLLTRPSFRGDLVEYLRNIEDTSRIVQKFLLGKGDTNDLISIGHSIDIWNTIKGRIALEKAFELKENERQYVEDRWKSLDSLISRLSDLGGLAKRIELAVESKEVYGNNCSSNEIKDEAQGSDLSETNPTTFPLLGADTNWTIKPQFSVELTNLHDRLTQLQSNRESLQAKFQEQYDASSLTLRHNSSHGMHIHIAKPRRDVARLEKSRQFIQIAESKTTKMFFNQDWFALGNSILQTMMAIYSAEKDAFFTLRNEVNADVNDIRRNARIFDELDVTSAFASLASEMNFIKPVITEGITFHIENGRHPAVELGLLESGRMFTSNSLSMSASSRLHVITGPNMAGKSTYLRQMALIAILAQTGSYVPADSAEIGLVDKVFSRIGAKDDLFRDRSTFMVEMLESADILNNATEKSLVIMDEVGRGTTVKDGLAIAFATVHHLYFVNKCRALFATHFHEIVDMLGFSEETSASDVFPDLEFSCTDINETEDGRFSYSHRMRSGVNRDSHGLKVAQLAGMPPLATEVAQEALSAMKLYQGRSVGDTSNVCFSEIGRRLAKTHL